VDLQSRSNKFSLAVLSHLTNELAAFDPWHLEENTFEQSRYAVILNMVRRFKPCKFLEVGPAAGVLTERLRKIASSLWIVDSMALALTRTHKRLNYDPSIVMLCSSISDTKLPQCYFDVVLICEVLYYLHTIRQVTRALRNCLRALKPSGTLIFSSACDEVVHRWGLKYGAESCLQILIRNCNVVELAEVTGDNQDEHALIVSLQPLCQRKFQQG